mgnify:CR=1 FL=1
MTPEGHRRLILIRHAKSAWDDPLMADHDRPLNTRGREAAQDLGQWLASRDYHPDEILCSTARRTVETFDVAASGLGALPEPKLVANLYHASPDVMMAVLRKATGSCVMMLGHNPGIAEFARSLPARAPADPDFSRYPTTATLVVDFEIADWSALDPHRGTVLDFHIPERR